MLWSWWTWAIGHVAEKMAKAFVAEVTVFSTTPTKNQESLQGLNADHFIVRKDEKQMQVSFFFFKWFMNLL